MKKGYKPYNPDFNSIEEISADDIKVLQDENYACIYVDKVFDHCWQKECLENFFIPSPNDGECEFKFIKFGQGEIVGEPEVKRSYGGSSAANVNNGSLVTYKYKIPFKAVFKCHHKFEEVEGYIEDEKTVTMYIPYARKDFPFRFIIETQTEKLDGTQVMNEDGGVTLTIGIIIVTKLIGKVQLAVAVREDEFCIPPRECNGIAPVDLCEEFLEEDFTGEGFYPSPDFQPPEYPPIVE